MEARDSQADARAVSKIDRLLDQSLAERASSDDHSPVIVLDGTGEDLTRGCAAFVDQNCEPDIPEYAPSISFVILAVAVKSLHVDDEVTLFKEKV